MKQKIKTLLLVVVIVAMVIPTTVLAEDGPQPLPDSGFFRLKKGIYWLTLLHNNDGESDLIDLGADLPDFGGIDRFKTVVDNLKNEVIYGPPDYPGQHRGVLMVSSGDNFLRIKSIQKSVCGIHHPKIIICNIPGCQIKTFVRLKGRNDVVIVVDPVLKIERSISKKADVFGRSR